MRRIGRGLPQGRAAARRLGARLRPRQQRRRGGRSPAAQQARRTCRSRRCEASGTASSPRHRDAGRPPTLLAVGRLGGVVRGGDGGGAGRRRRSLPPGLRRAGARSRARCLGRSGGRPWRARGYTVSSGAVLMARAGDGNIAWEETTEIPLMCLLMVLVIWHMERRNTDGHRPGHRARRARAVPAASGASAWCGSPPTRCARRSRSPSATSTCSGRATAPRPGSGGPRRSSARSSTGSRWPPDASCG